MKHFEKGSGCFTCISCGKATRNTIGNASARLCPHCYDLAGHENEHLDGYFENNDCGIEGCPFRGCKK